MRLHRAAAVMAMMSVGPAMVARIARDDLIDDDVPPQPKPEKPRREPIRLTADAPKAHQHKREIARRLRQQARLAEKRAKAHP